MKSAVVLILSLSLLKYEPEELMHHIQKEGSRGYGKGIPCPLPVHTWQINQDMATSD
jgi:hypothetical protein